MYLHLGGKTVVNTNEIIGIFDIEKTSSSKDTREFLRNRFKKLDIITVSYDMPSSYIVAQSEQSRQTVYISPISAATLRKRSNKIIG